MRRWTFMCALVIGLALAGSTHAASRYYKVVVGDTLSDIALRFECPLEELMLENELVNDHIVVGHRVKLPAPAFMQRQPEQQPITIVGHTIEEGDSLGLIAARYRTTIKAIKVWNVMSKDRIRLGQTIDVPAVGPVPKRETFRYTIEPGDSLRSIAERFGLVQRVVKRFNKGKDFGHLLVGEEIVLYRDVYLDPKPQVTPVPAPVEASAPTAPTATAPTATAPATPAVEAPVAPAPKPVTNGPPPMPKKVSSTR